MDMVTSVVCDVPIYMRSLQRACVADDAANIAAVGEELVQKWSADGCGIASASMAVESLLRLTDPHFRLPPVVQLCEILRDKAYIAGVGWRHGGLVAFAQHYGLESYNNPQADLADLHQQLATGWLAVVSVTLYLRGGEPQTLPDGVIRPRPKGGHLVVLSGLRFKGQDLKAVQLVDCQAPDVPDGALGASWWPANKFLASYSGKAIYMSLPMLKPV